jgi:hypothetical protein
MLSCLVDSNDLEEGNEFAGHNQYIGCKEYDRTIMNKLDSLRNLNLITQSIQQDQLNQINKNSPRSKRIMLVEDEDDIVLTIV